jgi:hypothetical protein
MKSDGGRQRRMKEAGNTKNRHECWLERGSNIQVRVVGYPSFASGAYVKLSPRIAIQLCNIRAVAQLGNWRSRVPTRYPHCRRHRSLHVTSVYLFR